MDFDRFVPALEAWWRSVQPIERGEDGTRRVEGLPPSAWEKVRVPSKNGFYLFLVGLTWWRKAIHASSEPPAPELVNAWQAFVEDIAWVTTVWGVDAAKGWAISGKRKANDTEPVEQPTSARRSSKRRR